MGCGSSTEDTPGGGLSTRNPERKGTGTKGTGDGHNKALKLSNSILEHAGDVRDSYTFDKVCSYIMINQSGWDKAMRDPEKKNVIHAMQCCSHA